MHIRTLLIDDNDDFRQLLEKLLGQANIRIQLDRRKRFDPNEKHDFYLINFDSQIYGLIESIRAHVPHAKFFIIFGQKDSALLKDVFSLNVSGFLDKDDFNATPLIEIVKKFSLSQKLARLSEAAKDLKDICFSDQGDLNPSYLT